MFFKIFASFVLLTAFTVNLSAANVGLLIMATGKYIKFTKPLIESSKKYFCTNHHVTYYVFTDGQGEEIEDVIYINQSRLGWPYDTLMRFRVYEQQSELLSTQDYLFCCDADMLFVDFVGDEILGKRVGTQHPGYVNKRGTYETNPLSKACVKKSEGKTYFAGGFYGGSSKEVLKLCKINADNIEDDLNRGIVAVWHDESHLNRYFIDHKPTLVLNPSYCYPESLDLPYPKKLLALDKNHQEVRE